MTEPQLAPPGAGLPGPELFIARMLFAFKRATGNRKTFAAKFRQERAHIASLVNGLKPERAGQRVLIPRLRGLEDSRRYWSVWMTLDHLRIVHGSIVKVGGALGKGVVPPGQASTANVKPSPDVTGAVVATYESSCDELLATFEALPDLKTRMRYSHPWFGALNASGWQALSATHIAIHRKQIQEIIARLGA